MLIYWFFALTQTLSGLQLMQISFWVELTYSSWAVGQFFDSHRISNYVKAFFACILGMFTFTALAIIVGILIYGLAK
ncbi:MAG: hypothetical protein NZ551_05940 [Microscillaceae bacterium]|nr:hypothetical protein [Microscillaceae bacterium]MDW8460734.1 hypothetical protein [Cytophagales bacterium]